MRRLIPSSRILLVLLALLLAVAAAVGVGAAVFDSTDASAVEVRDEIWREVTDEPVSEQRSFPAIGAQPPNAPIPAPLSGRITEVFVTADSRPGEGDKIAAIQGLPIFAVDRQQFVPYRDLALTASGNDVRELKLFLNRQGFLDPAEGTVFDTATEAAVEAFYQHQGIEKQKVFLATTAMPMDTPLNIESVTVERGRVVNEGDSLGTVSLGSPSISGVVSDEVSQILSPGLEVDVAAGDAVLPGKVGEIGELAPGPDGRAGRTVTIEVDGADNVEPGRDYRVTVTIRSSSRSNTTVPSLAIQTDSAGQNFVIARDGANEVSRRVNVEIELSDGEVASVAAAELKVGTEVLVP